MVASFGEWKDTATLDEIVGGMIADLEAASREGRRPEPVMRRYGYAIWDWWLASGREVPAMAPSETIARVIIDGPDGGKISVAWPREQAKTA